MMNGVQILLTNDDGIQSPGLWAAAEALSGLGYVHVVAPRDQYSGAGRSMPSTSDGIIKPHPLVVHGKQWTVYSVGGSPAQAVEHALLEILPSKPDLVVSGINFGENASVGITASGTVGAAMEAATFGIPALAISLEMGPEHYFSHSEDIDFSVAGHFAAFFGQLLLEKKLLHDVHLINVNVPGTATIETPWKVCRLSPDAYFELFPPQRQSWDEPAQVGFRLVPNPKYAPGTDCYVLHIEKKVAVSPLSLDLTSRVDLDKLDSILRC